MNGLNRVIILGTLGADPKPLTSREGKNYTSLSLATNRFWKNKEGVVERRTEWHKVTVWGKQGALCQDHLKKGAPVCVEGRLATYEVEDQGQKRWFTSIMADEVNFLPHHKEQTPA